MKKKKEALKQIKAGKDEEDNDYFSLADADKKLKADKEVLFQGSGYFYVNKNIKYTKENIADLVNSLLSDG